MNGNFVFGEREFGTDFFEFFPETVELLHGAIFNRDFAVSEHCGQSERAGFEVIGGHGVGRSFEGTASVNREGVGADALNLRAHGDQKVTEVLHVRLHGGPTNFSFSGNECRGHEGVFCGGDAGLRHDNFCGFESGGFEMNLFVAFNKFRAECAKRVNVSVNRAFSKHASAWKGEAHFFKTRQEWAEQ